MMGSLQVYNTDNVATAVRGMAIINHITMGLVLSKIEVDRRVKTNIPGSNKIATTLIPRE
jgi:hypothetical protein